MPNNIPLLLSEGGTERLPGGGAGVTDQEGERLRLRALTRVCGAGLHPPFLPRSEARVVLEPGYCSSLGGSEEPEY